MVPNPYLSAKVAALYLKLPLATLNKMRCAGAGPRFVKLGRRAAYNKADLDAFITGGTSGPAGDASDKSYDSRSGAAGG